MQPKKDNSNRVVPVIQDYYRSPSPEQVGRPKKKKKNRNKKTREELLEEFNAYFGDLHDVENWRKLCRDVGILEDLNSITQCKKALKHVWVNIRDLLKAQSTGRIPRRFNSQRDLAQYTQRTGKFFPKGDAKEGPIKALLAHVYG